VGGGGWGGGVLIFCECIQMVDGEVRKGDKRSKPRPTSITKWEKTKTRSPSPRMGRDGGLVVAHEDKTIQD